MAIDKTDKDALIAEVAELSARVSALLVIPTEKINVNGVDRDAEVIKQANGNLTVIIKDIPDPNAS
jgi:hypothetical protein